MHIIQFFNNTKNDHINRYILELETAIYNYTDYEIQTYLLTEESENYNKFNIIESNISFINSCDYLFIHSLPTKKNEFFNQLIHNIKTKIILFIHYNNIKDFYNNFNINYLSSLFSLCYKIVIYDNDKIYNEILKFTIPEKIVKQNIIYNSPITFFDRKENQIAMISHHGLNTNYDLYIDMFKQLKDEFDCTWHLYGITKNIQTLSIKDLYYDENGNPSNITNINEDIIRNDKINIHSKINYDSYNELLDKIMFVVDFDKFEFITYSMLDILAGKALLILDINIAKKIKINNKQSLYDLNCAIYYDKNNINSYKILFNKYFKSVNTYIAFCNKNKKIINQVFNTKNDLQDLFNKII